MQLAQRTVLADISDLYFADTIILELREHIATWLGQPTTTREQAVLMCNWLFAHAAFNEVPPEHSIKAWIAMVKAADLVPTGCELVTTEKGVLAVL